MLADIRYWENDATNKHYAIAHFNVWNAEMLMVLSGTPHLKISLT